MEIKIDPEFKSLIPKISEDELKGLEESLLNEGCRDPLVLWDEILLDGHNRYEICTHHEIKFKTVGKTFDNRDQAKLWIICNQLSRRNLAPKQIQYLRGMRYQLEKKEPIGFKDRDLSGGKNYHREKTSEILGKEYGVSEKTIRDDSKFAEAVNKLSKKEKEEILSGKSPKTKSELIGRSRSNKEVKIKYPKVGPPCSGMQYARIAVLNLKNIQKNDSERKEAFEYVKNWIAENE